MTTEADPSTPAPEADAAASPAVSPAVSEGESAAPATSGPPEEKRSTEPSGEQEPRRSPRRYTQLSERNRCRFTRAGVKRIDYKDIATLQKLITAQGKILSRKRTGIAARYQRKVKSAVKRARFMALLPYTG